MESILGFVGIVIGWFVISFVWGLITSGASSAAKASVRTMQGKGSFSDNFSTEFTGMKPLELRARIEEQQLDDGEPFKKITIEMRGLLPNRRKTHISSAVTLFTKSPDGEFHPVISALDSWQEKNTVIYLHHDNLGIVDTNLGYKDWTQIGVAIIPTLTPCWGGKQTVYCVLNLLDANINDSVEYGFPDDKNAVLGTYEAKVDVVFEESGYIESADNNAAMKPLAVKLAVAVATADGDFDTAEGEIIKDWIQRQLTVIGESRVESVKSACNEALKETYATSMAGNLSISNITGEINSLASESDKYEVIELCMDVMAADGEADQSEMDVIWRIAKSLGLNRAEVEKIKDKKVLGLNLTSNVEGNSVNELLGIDPNWSQDETKEFLKREFKKWNSRLHSVNTEEEKANVQRMLDAISEARKNLG